MKKHHFFYLKISVGPPSPFSIKQNKNLGQGLHLHLPFKVVEYAKLDLINPTAIVFFLSQN
jgi:hypothetical protein